jgi:hypothetical protein
MAEQLSALASGFLEWSAEARASLLQELRDVVARQVQDMGLATKKDLDALRARLDRLEERVPSPTKAAKGAKGAGAARSAKATRATRVTRGRSSSSAGTGRSKAGSSSSKKAVSGRRRASRERG